MNPKVERAWCHRFDPGMGQWCVQTARFLIVADDSKQSGIHFSAYARVVKGVDSSSTSESCAGSNPAVRTNGVGLYPPIETAALVV